MNFFKKHNIFLRILSLIIAIFLWSYVVLATDPSKTGKFQNKVVEPIGSEELAERNLVLVNTTEPKINISIVGTSSNIVRLAPNDIKATVDLSDIQEAGVYYLKPEVAVPTQSESISFRPRRLQFAVENIVSKNVPVHVTTRNELAEDKIVDVLTPSQTSIAIRGAESVVSTVEYALLTVDLDGMTRDITQNCRITLYAAGDTLIDSPLVTPAVDALDVSVKLNHVVEVPVNVPLLSAPALTADMVDAQPEPKTIHVYGSKADVSRLSSVTVESIDLRDVKNDRQEFTRKIKLPFGVRLMKNEPDSAKVVVTMKTDVK